MALRDLLLTLMIFGSLPLILKRPYIGILVWSWLSYMNPHRQTWGFAYDMPFAYMVALTLFAAILFSKEKHPLPMNGTVVVWLLFLGWAAVTTVFALFPDGAMTLLIKVYKIQIVTFLTIMLINDKRKMDQLIWVIVLSIGFYSVKGGIFTLATGGAFRVYGPPESYITENNALAVAGLVVIPLYLYLADVHKDSKIIRYGLYSAALLATVAVVGSQSRGAALALLAVGGFFWLKTKSKVITAPMILVLAGLVYSFMPQSWHDRMDTIQNYQQDESAMARLNAWQYAVNVANARITGGGMQAWRPESFRIWAPDPSKSHSAHSIYFSIIGDHGWIGFLLWLTIMGLTWRRLSAIIRRTRGRPELSSENRLAKMLQVGFIAYMSGGAFLSLAYFDLPWHLVALAIVLERHVAQASGEPEAYATRQSGALQSTPRGIR